MKTIIGKYSLETFEKHQFKRFFWSVFMYKKWYAGFHCAWYNYFVWCQPLSGRGIFLCAVCGSVGKWYEFSNEEKIHLYFIFIILPFGCWVPKLISSTWNYYIRYSRAALWLFEVRTNLKHKDFKIYKLMGMSVINVLHPTFSFQMA